MFYYFKQIFFDDLKRKTILIVLC